MSFSETLIKIGGIVLFIVGVALLLGAVGIKLLGVSFLGPIWSIILGVIFIGFGIFIIRGGRPTL